MTMAATESEMGRDQDKFYTVYRGKHSRLRARSYMRVGKTHAARLLLGRNGIALRGKAIFDYGFGPGSFFLNCAIDCELAGLELDPENVAAVGRVLADRGYENVDLDSVEASGWAEHPLLDRRYDLVILSHVLEHLDDPVAVLRRLSGSLGTGGSILGLLPLNEITPDENHKWICDRNLVEEWAAAAGCRVTDYLECDHWVYYTLPVFQGRWLGGSLAAQGLGLGLGLAASCFSPRAWFGLGRALLGPLGAKPSQAVFLLERDSGK